MKRGRIRRLRMNSGFPSAVTKKAKTMSLPEEIKAVVNRASTFVNGVSNEEWNGLKQALGQLQWERIDDGVKGSARITAAGKASAKANGSSVVCVNADCNLSATRAYGVICALDSFRRNPLVKLTNWKGESMIDDSITFERCALGKRSNQYLQTFAIVSQVLETAVDGANAELAK